MPTLLDMADLGQCAGFSAFAWQNRLETAFEGTTAGEG